MPEDTFICGRCQTNFNEINDFVAHKNQGCQVVIDTKIFPEVSEAVESVIPINIGGTEGNRDIQTQNQTVIIIQPGTDPDGNLDFSQSLLDSNILDMVQASTLNAALCKPPAKRPGRQRRTKTTQEKTKKEVEKPTVPEIGSDGKLHCKCCKRSFTKERFFVTHKCLAVSDYVDITKKGAMGDDADDDDFDDDDDELSEGEDEEEYKVEEDENFKPPSTPVKLSVLNEEKLSGIESVQVSTDPDIDSTLPEKRNNTGSVDDIPVFASEEDKIEFEKCLNIDLSGVDHMFRQHMIQQDLNENAPSVSRQMSNSLSLYSCNTCDKIFKTLSHMRLHCFTHTNIKPFRCPKCNYSSNSKGNLYTHMRKHTGQYYTCRFCSFKSVNKSHLFEHEETHDKLKHRCEICKKDYNTVKSLVNHVRKYHFSSKRGKDYLQTFLQGRQVKGATVIHQCHVCNRKFKKKVDRDRHLFVHDITDIPNIQRCVLCDYTASRRVYLDKHFLKHRVIYRCVECNEKYLSTIRLIDHLVSVHLDSDPGNKWEDLFEQCINYSLYLPEPDETLPEEEKLYLNLPPELSSTVMKAEETLSSVDINKADSNVGVMSVDTNKAVEGILELNKENSDTCSVDIPLNENQNQTVTCDGTTENLDDKKSLTENQNQTDTCDGTTGNLDDRSLMENQNQTDTCDGTTGNLDDKKSLTEDDEMQTEKVIEKQNFNEDQSAATSAADNSQQNEISKDGLNSDPLTASENKQDQISEGQTSNLSSTEKNDQDQISKEDQTATAEKINDDQPSENGQQSNLNEGDKPSEELMTEKGSIDTVNETENADKTATITDDGGDEEEVNDEENIANRQETDMELEAAEDDKEDDGTGVMGEEIITRLGYHQMSMEIFQKMRETFGNEECEYCGKLYYSKTDFENHIRTHTGDKPYFCDLCGYRAITKDNLNRHREKEHDRLTFTCKDCDYVTTSRAQLWNHTMKHRTDLGISCPQCQQKFENMKKLRGHFDTEHEGMNLDEQLKVAGYLKHRMQGKLGRRSYKCPYCDRIFIRASSELQKHIWIHEGIKPFKCPICPHACRSKNNLQAHMLRHTNTKPFACPECGKSYKSKTALRWHVRSHKDGKLFKCEKCPYEATQSSHLKRHMETHDVIKRFVCQHCNYSANTLGYMKIHYTRLHKGQQYIHTAETEQPSQSDKVAGYRCLSCDYLFGNLSDLKRHLKIRHHIKVNQLDGLDHIPGDVQVVQYNGDQVVLDQAGETVETFSTVQPIQTTGNFVVPSQLDEKTASAVNILQQIIDMSNQGSLGSQQFTVQGEDGQTQQITVRSQDGQLVTMNPETIIVQQEGDELLVTEGETQLVDGNQQFVIQYVTPQEAQINADDLVEMTVQTDQIESGQVIVPEPMEH